jgi:nucleolar protein 56
MKYKFKNVLGTFILDEKLNIISNQDEEAENLPKEKIFQVLELFKDKKYFKQFYIANLKLTKQGIKDAVKEDQLIMQTISNVIELDKVNNIFTKRLREWYSLYLPELSKRVVKHEIFVELISKPKEELIKEFSVEQTMGADLDKFHIDEMKLLAEQIKDLNKLRETHEEYLRKIMEKYCPNLLELGGVTTAAKLIELAKGLRRLALLPSSTVQLLGAEKALFRHIKTGSRSPKHGVILHHPIVQNVPRRMKGKAARMLADKLSLCARLDFFKGEIKGNEYRKELEKALEDE